MDYFSNVFLIKLWDFSAEVGMISQMLHVFQYVVYESLPYLWKTLFRIMASYLLQITQSRLGEYDFHI